MADDEHDDEHDDRYEPLTWRDRASTSESNALRKNPLLEPCAMFGLRNLLEEVLHAAKGKHG